MYYCNWVTLHCVAAAHLGDHSHTQHPKDGSCLRFCCTCHLICLGLTPKASDLSMPYLLYSDQTAVYLVFQVPTCSFFSPLCWQFSTSVWFSLSYYFSPPGSYSNTAVLFNMLLQLLLKLLPWLFPWAKITVAISAVF